jgi:Flp pilus assembly protein TadG
MRHLAHILHRLQRRERGQVFVMVVLLLAVIGGMTAIAVDLGSYSAHRRDLQNAADAIALAASLELPSGSAARTVADEWAVKNGIDPADMTVTIIPQNLPSEPNPKVRVELAENHGFTFARLVGITNADVGARASAIKTSAAGGSGVVPLSVTEGALNGVGLGDEVVLKYDANNITSGNTSPIRIDGPGSGNCDSSDNYCTGVRYGSEEVVCADGTVSEYCAGPTTVSTEPGNKVGGTRTAIDWRLDVTEDPCNDFDGVFEPDPDDPGAHRIIQECNPFIEGGPVSERVLIVPVIDQLCNGTCTVTIVDFALFFLERIGSGDCTGNDCEVIGRFVRVNQNVGLLAGTYDPNSSNQFVRLVE